MTPGPAITHSSSRSLPRPVPAWCAATPAGWPVLVALSRKDFVGEALDLPPDERLPGTLAATAVCAWHGAAMFRTHDVRATREVLDMVASIRGTRPPAVARRGLA